MFSFDPAMEERRQLLFADLYAEERVFAQSMIVEFREMLGVWSVERRLASKWRFSFADRVSDLLRKCGKEEPEKRSYLMRSVVLGRFILDMMLEVEKHAEGGLVGMFGEEFCQMSLFQRKYEELFAPFCAGRGKAGGTVSSAIRDEEWVLLRHFALAMEVAVKFLVGTRLHKTLLVAACAAVEGRRRPRKYIAGGRQSRETSWRHLLYRAISGCEPVRRPGYASPAMNRGPVAVSSRVGAAVPRRVGRPVLPVLREQEFTRAVQVRAAARRKYRLRAKLRRECAADRWMPVHVKLEERGKEETQGKEEAQGEAEAQGEGEEEEVKSTTTHEESAEDEDGVLELDEDTAGSLLDLEHAMWLDDECFLDGWGDGAEYVRV